MKKFEEALNYLIELSGRVLTGQAEVKQFEKHRADFIDAYDENKKVKIPKAVAEAFETLEDEGNEMKTIGRLRFWSGDTVYHVDDEVQKWVNNNEREVLRAMLYGYTVEE